MDWIERCFGLAPDGGNGSLEYPGSFRRDSKLCALPVVHHSIRIA